MNELLYEVITLFGIASTAFSLVYLIKFFIQGGIFKKVFQFKILS